MSDKGYKIVITVMIVLALFAVMLNIFLWNADEKFEGSIKVRENGITETVIPVRDLVLTPGASNEYHVDLICDATGSYFVEIEYEETYDGGMKHFVNTKILSDDKLIFEGPLTDLIDKKIPVEFEEELHASEPVVITFIYSMPVETGNEAQHTSAKFDLHVKIEKS